MLKKLKKYNLHFLIFALILVTPFLFGFIKNGFPQTDDGNWMVIRFSAFYEALRQGQLPVRFLLRLNNDFGYPVSNFLYPLFMYLGVPIHLIGFNFNQTIKMLFTLSILFSTVFTFLWLRKIFDNISSTVGAVLYTLFPYHLYDIFKRGSLGEAISFPVLSFILWNIERNSLVLTSIGIFFLILSHNTLALFFLILIIIYALFRKKTKLSLYSISLGLGMSSFFWIPAIYDLQFTVFSKTNVSNFNSYFSDSLTLMLLGLPFLFLLIELLFMIIKRKGKKYIYSFLFLIVISSLLFSVSKLVWNLLPITKIIQFPFRLISIIIPVSAFLVADLVNGKKTRDKYLLFFIFIILIFASAVPFINNIKYQNFEDSFYSTNLDTTTVQNEYMPKWVKEKPQYLVNKIETSGNEKVNLKQFNAKTISFDTYLTKREDIKVNLVYFPGWVLYINGVKSNINFQKDGIVRFTLDKGQNNVVIRFEETKVRLVSDFLSIISLLMLVVIYKKYEFN